MLAAVESSELWLSVLGIVATIVGATIGGAKWLGGFFSRLIESARADRETDRVADREDRAKARDIYTASLLRVEESHAAGVKAMEQSCAQQRELDRQQRELDREQRETDRAVILRLAGLDTASFKVKKIALPGDQEKTT